MLVNTIIRTATVLLVVAISGMLSGIAHAEDLKGKKDHEGCADPAALKRFTGSIIYKCEKRNFAEYTLPTGLDMKKDALKLEGKLIQNLYMEPLEASSLEVFRNYKDELSSKGFNILFEAHKAETEPLAHYFGGFGPGGQSIYYNAVDGHYIAAVKEEGGVKSYVALYVVEYRDGFDGLSFSPSKNQGLVRLDVLAVGNMSSQMTTISASQITKSIETDGKVALYGLLFDFNKATLRPDSRPTLEQMAKYLTDNPAQKIYIVGHTDNVGGFEFNLDLSKARAATVAAELAQTYKIDPTRITATGVGLLAPVASNAAEEGRAKNRRVELVAR